MRLDQIFDPQVVWVLVPVAAIIVGGAIAIAKLVIRHRERIAMIERGIDPDRLDSAAGREEGA